MSERLDGIERIATLVREGHGVVIFTGHCGNWEWLAATIAYNVYLYVDIPKGFTDSATALPVHEITTDQRVEPDHDKNYDRE